MFTRAPYHTITTCICVICVDGWKVKHHKNCYQSISVSWHVRLTNHPDHRNWHRVYFSHFHNFFSGKANKGLQNMTLRGAIKWGEGLISSWMSWYIIYFTVWNSTRFEALKKFCNPESTYFFISNSIFVVSLKLFPEDQKNK